MGIGKLWEKSNKLQGRACNGLASHPGEVEILLATLCHRNWGISSGSYEPVGFKHFT